MISKQETKKWYKIEVKNSEIKNPHGYNTADFKGSTSNVGGAPENSH